MPNSVKPYTTPRVLTQVPHLARPIEQLEPDILMWATQLGFGEINERHEFEHLYLSTKGMPYDGDRKYLITDLEIARGSLRAVENYPEGGWDRYLEIWTLTRLEGEKKNPVVPEFARLKNIESVMGGILLDSRVMPLMLVIPQPGGTYIQMGWESVVEIDGSPFLPTRDKNKILKQHILPGSSTQIRAPHF